MADQLVTLGLDEREYQEGLKSLMRQSRGEFATMARDVGSPFKALARSGLYIGGLQKAIGFGSRALEQYANTSAQARREVEGLTGAVDKLYAGIGRDLARLGGGAGGFFDQLEAAREAAVDVVADSMATVMHFQKPGAQLEALEAERQVLRRGEELERTRLRRVAAEQGLAGEQEAFLKAIGADREAARIGALKRFGAKRDDLRTLLNDGRIDRGGYEDVIRAAERTRDAELARAGRDADAVLEKSRIDDGDRLMQREADLTAQAIEDAEARAREIGELEERERDLRLDALRAKGFDLLAEKEASRMRLERDLRDIRTSEYLSAEERSAREARLKALHGELGAARGLRPERDTLQSVAAGTSGLGSVIAGAFGRDLRGGADVSKPLEKIREAAAASLLEQRRMAGLLSTIANKVGVAVYG